MQKLQIFDILDVCLLLHVIANLTALHKIGFRTDDLCSFCGADQKLGTIIILYKRSHFRQLWNTFGP